MFRTSKMVGLALFGFLLVACTMSSAQQGKEEEKKTEKGKFGPGAGGRGRPQPGKIFSTYVITQLKLTEEQTKQLEAMQKDVDEKVAKLLTDDQKAKLKEISTTRGGFPGGRQRGKDKDKKDEKKDN